MASREDLGRRGAVDRDGRRGGRLHRQGRRVAHVRGLDVLVDTLPDALGRQAFRHPSWVTDREASYERLEFLGDAVLGAAVAEAVWRRFPAAPEGTLARMKGYAVSREACAQVAERLGLGARLAGEGRATGGEAAEQLARNRRVLAAVLEAAIGAVYLTHGWETTRAAVVEAFDEQLRFARHGHVDVKTELQEHLHRQTRSVEYVVVGDTGPPHLRRFVVAALVDGVEVGRGEGATKKAAEQAAAAGALSRLRPGPEHGACI